MKRLIILISLLLLERIAVVVQTFIFIFSNKRPRKLDKMELTDEASINKSITLFYKLLTQNGQRVNSSNVVFDSGGVSQANKSIRNIESSGLRLIAMVCPISVIFVLAVTGMS